MYCSFVYAVDGVDIDDCMMLEDSDIVFLAEHHDQEFIKNTDAISDFKGTYSVINVQTWN